jgi:hypothetical protein
MNDVKTARRLRPSKDQFFDGLTVLCLSSFGLPGGKEHRETARSGRSVPPDEPAQPEKRVKGCGT